MARHTTAKGVSFDMERFVQNNPTEVALGNMSANANGDVLGKGGEIVVKRDEIVRQYYREAPSVTVDAPISSISVEPPKAVEEVFLTPAEALKEVEQVTPPTPKPTPKKKTTKGK